VLQRSWVGLLLALGAALLLWIGSRSLDGDVILWVGTALSALAIFELDRLGNRRGRGLCWLLLPAAVALLVFNVALTAARPGAGASHVPYFSTAELVSSYALVLLATAVALLESRFTVWKRPYLAALFAALALGLIFFPGFDASAVAVDWPAAGALVVALAAVLALARQSSRLGGSTGGSAGGPAAGPAGAPAGGSGGGAAGGPVDGPGADGIAGPLWAAAWVVVPLPALVHVWTNYGFYGLVALIVLSKIGDIAGYYVGSAIGRVHPFPELSPKKTLEGCIASCLAGTLAGAVCVLLRWLPDAGWTAGLLAGLVVNLAAQAGDLFESRVKRRAGVKDSGRLFGPSGGVLDVLDSLLFTVPTALLVWPVLFT
jgi:hypothetical protein